MNARSLTTETVEQYQLRLPATLREKLKSRATANRRSLNSEILVCLEKAVASTTEGEPNGTRA
ncbi:Arc family DNA-binding protein [Ciceribacter sp. RN22]|uniref:Arc family DNA-binding protein n=1 Tax=Ciceribacter sp. RN22 TaxID=2954932 RepID=UPI0035B18815